MYRTTKAQRKNMDRIEAWLRQQPFKENSRDKKPQVPQLTVERVLADWIPSWDPKETGQFFTPLEMGRSLLERLRISPGDRVLEPCAGIGHLVYQLAEAGCISLDAYEVSPECATLGQRLFPWANWQEADVFERLHEIEGQYDVVVANPPFGTSWAMAAGLAKSEGRARRSEHLFLELITRALKPGGQAAVIGPYNLVEKMPKAMQEWFEARMRLDDSFGPLPGEFGLTGVKVHAFYFTRLEEPVIETAPAPDLPASEGLSVVIDREVLGEALVMVSAAAAKGSSLPVLRNVVLAADNGRLKLQTNSLDLAMTTWVTPAAIGPQGEIAAPAHFLTELVRLLPKGYVSLAVGESEQRDMFGRWNTLKVQSGAYRSNLRATAAEECPVVQRLAGQAWVVEAAQLAGMLKQVVHYADQKGDCGAAVLGGVLFQVRTSQLTMVATNRVCLALSTNTMTIPDMDVVVPINVLAALLRHLRRAETVEIVLAPSSVMFSLPDLEIVGHLLGEPYPDYSQVVPRNYTTQVYLNGGRLQEMVNLARRFNELGIVTLKVSGNGNGSGRVTVANSETELGDYSGSLEAVVAGEAVEVMFKGELLLKGLAALGQDQIEIALNGSGTPVVFQAGGSKQVICPLVQ